MVNFVVGDNPEYQLDAVLKGYQVDQDKFIHPKITYRKAYKALVGAFSQKEFKLIKVKETDSYNVYSFSDGTLTTHGKGATSHQAKASAIMEFVERISWLNYDYQNAPGYIKASYNRLSTENDISGIDRAFYVSYSKNKDQLFNTLLDLPMDWVKGYSLTDKKYTLYPLSWNNTYQLSNGLASGNVKEEAIFQGLCEVIERQNLSDFLLSEKEYVPDLIDNSTLNNPVLLNIINALKKEKVDIYLFDISGDINVPTIMAYGHDRKPVIDMVEHGYGYGTHSDPQKAMIRAVTEYLQQREGFVRDKDQIKDMKFARGHWQFYLSIDIENILRKAHKKALTGLNDLSTDDIHVEIEEMVKIASDKGYNVILVNKTHPKLNIPVYRVFIPGVLSPSAFSSQNENEHTLMTATYFQAGMDNEAKKYIKEHYKDFYNEGYIQHLQQEYVNPAMTNRKEDIFNDPKFKPFADILAPTISELVAKYSAQMLSEKVPVQDSGIEENCRGTYLEYLKRSTLNLGK